MYAHPDIYIRYCVFVFVLGVPAEPKRVVPIFSRSHRMFKASRNLLRASAVQHRLRDLPENPQLSSEEGVSIQVKS